MFSVDDLASATCKDLRNVGFTSAFAKTLIRLRSSTDWNVDKIWQLKKHGGLGLRPSHFDAIRYAKITDDERQLDIELLRQKNRRVRSVTHLMLIVVNLKTFRFPLTCYIDDFASLTKQARMSRKQLEAEADKQRDLYWVSALLDRRMRDY